MYLSKKFVLKNTVIFFFQNVSKMQHQSNLFWKIPNIKIRIYYQFFSNFNKHCYQNRLFLKHEPWKMTNVVLFILMNFWYFPQFLPHFAALDLLRQIFHPQICRLPRQAANMTCIIVWEYYKGQSLQESTHILMNTNN